MESHDDDMPPLEDEQDLCTANTSETTPTSEPSNASSDKKPIVDDDDEDDDNDDDWEEMDESESQVVNCLFCEEQLPSIEICLGHLKNKHAFDFVSYLNKLKLDQISFIKLINYIRSSKPTPEQLDQDGADKWSSDDYMKPVNAEDAWLMYDVEEVSSKDKPLDTATLQARCDEYEEIIEKQRESMTRMLQAAHANSQNEDASIRTVGDIRPEEDEGYFSSYAHFDIHHEMLSDKVRTESYRDAILKNPSVFAGKRVMDLGCGTAILSMFCAQAGASVTAVDMSDIIYKAMDIVKENNLEKSIKLCKGKLEDIEFEGQFDVIVSEWMGYFLLFEGMLDSVLHARDKHLAQGGMLLPNRCTMHLVGMQDEESFNKYVSFWEDVYGFKMSCLKNDVVKEANTDVIKKEKIITSAATIADFDLMTIMPNDTEFTSDFSLTVERDGQLSGFVGYFDTFFELPTLVQFSTSPFATPTHWKQTVFYLPSLLPVSKGEVLSGKITVRRRREIRSLYVLISFNDKKFKYIIE